MHATYYFLTGLDRTLQDGSIWQQAENQIINYAIGYCDENNWWELESVVLDDDQWAVQECPLRQHAGLWRRTWVEATWALVYEFKWNLPATYTKGELPGVKADMTRSRESLGNMLSKEIPAFLEWAYGQKADCPSQPEDSLDRYRRSRIAMAYELFLTPVAPDRYPFTDDIRSPYAYRAFDLTGGEPANAIIRVDIHT